MLLSSLVNTLVNADCVGKCCMYVCMYIGTSNGSECGWQPLGLWHVVRTVWESKHLAINKGMHTRTHIVVFGSLLATSSRSLSVFSVSGHPPLRTTLHSSCRPSGCVNQRQMHKVQAQRSRMRPQESRIEVHLNGKRAGSRRSAIRGPKAAIKHPKWPCYLAIEVARQNETKPKTKWNRNEPTTKR